MIIYTLFIEIRWWTASTVLSPLDSLNHDNHTFCLSICCRFFIREQGNEHILSHEGAGNIHSPQGDDEDDTQIQGDEKQPLIKH